MSASFAPRHWPVLTPIRRIYLAMFFVSIAQSAVSAVFPPFAQSAGYDIAAVGLLVSAFSVLSLASRLPAGALFTGRRGPLFAVGTTVLLAVSTAAYAVPADLWLLLAVRSINGFAYGVVTTVNMAQLMGAIDRPEQRPGVTGWYLGWIAAGHAVGGYVSGFLADTLGYEATYLLSALMVLGSLPFARVAPAPGARRAGAVPGGPTPGGPRERRWEFLLSLPLLVPALQAFTINALSHLMWTFYPLYGLQVGLSLSVIGLQRGSYSMTSMITRPFVGDIGKRLDHRRLATWGLVVTAALTMLVPFFTAFLPLLALHVLLGGLRSGALVGSMVAAVEAAGGDARKRGMAAGVYSFGSDGANVMAPLVGGLVAERIGLAPTFWALPLALMGVYFALLAASAVVARHGR